MFVKSLKKLIARWGNPKIMYSDNAKTLKAGAKGFSMINKYEKSAVSFVIKRLHRNLTYQEHSGRVANFHS